MQGKLSGGIAYTGTRRRDISVLLRVSVKNTSALQSLRTRATILAEAKKKDGGQSLQA